MRGSALIAGIALYVPAAAADAAKVRAPSMFAITSTHQRHSGETAVAGGPSSWAVVWDDFPPDGPDSPVRTLRAAIVSPGGKVALAPKSLWAATTSSPEVLAAWNGKSFTIVVCSDYWSGGDKTMLWGELATDGSFTPRGQKAFAQGAFYCAAAIPVGDRVDVIVVDHDTQYGANDAILSEKCKTTRVALTGEKIAIGPALPLCEVTAADATWIVGEDLKHKLEIADAKGKLWKPPLPYPANGVFDGDGGIVVVAPDKAFKAEEWNAIDPAKKKIAKHVAMEIANDQVSANVDGLLLPGGLLGLFSAGSGGEALTGFGADGKIRWIVDGIGEAIMSGRECAASGGALLCTWTDDDAKTNRGEVRAVEIKLP
jgi:hypothetical protein